MFLHRFCVRRFLAGEKPEPELQRSRRVENQGSDRGSWFGTKSDCSDDGEQNEKPERNQLREFEGRFSLRGRHCF